MTAPLTRVSTAMIAGLPMISGGASQTLESILSERVSVRRFGAKGDGSHDDTAALQAAITWAIANSARLHLPRGRYKVTAGLVADLSANTADNGNRFCLEGEGEANSVLIPTSALGAGTLLRLQGGASGAGMQAWSEIHGIGMELVGATAVAIAAENIAFFKLGGVRIIGASYGMYFRDVLSGIIEKCNIRFCKYGFFADRNGDGGADAYHSGPNNLNFIGTTIGLCAEWGVTLKQGAVCNWLGGSIEHCGYGGSGESRYGVLVSDAGLEGSVGATFQGVYFEGNVGYADIWISQGDYSCAYLVNGCTFNRLGDPTNIYLTEGGVPTSTNTGIYNPWYQRYTASNIRVETNSRPVALSVNGNGFRGLMFYTESADRPYIAHPNHPLVQISQHGNLFGDKVAAPYWSELPNVYAYMGSNQTVGNASLDLVSFNSTNPNDGGWYDAANSRLVVYRRCRLLIQAAVFWSDLPSGSDHSISIYRNGSAYAGVAGSQITRLMDVDPGTVVQIVAYQASGSPRTIGQNPAYSFFTAHVV